MKSDYLEFGAGSPVVLIHPFPHDARMWQAVGEQLTGWQVILPNLRGCGKTPLGSAAPDLNLLAEDIWQLCDELGFANPVIGGISLGGYVAMAMLRAQPARPKAIALFDTKASADAPEAKDTRIRMAKQLRDSGRFDLLVEQMLSSALGTTTQSSRPQVVSQVRTWMNSQEPATVAWLQEAMAGRQESFAVLGDFPGSALLVRGAEDGISTAADFAAMAKVLPKAKLVELPGCGHLPPVEDPTATARVLADWLNALK